MRKVSSISKLLFLGFVRGPTSKVSFNAVRFPRGRTQPYSIKPLASSIDDLFQGTGEGTLFDLESLQFETEIEGSKLRRDVLAEGSVSSGGAPISIVSMLSGQEEMFAFCRARQRREYEHISAGNIQPQLSF